MDRRAFCQTLGASVALMQSNLLHASSSTEFAGLVAGEETREQREALELLLKVLVPSRKPVTGRINAFDRTWEEWQRRTGELPPKFSALPSQPWLPDLLTGVHSPAEWTQRQDEIRKHLDHWLIGRVPPAPENLRAVVTGETREGKITVRDVRLDFGPEHRATLRLQLLIPPHHGPLPVFLTNHHRDRPWAATAVARGYMGVIYFASDPIYGSEDDSDKYIEIYPEYDFTCIARWAWAASRAVDYLYTLPEVDRRCIAVAGHSRNGKQAVIAGAIDKRITAVVTSSGNTGAENPWRYTSGPFVNESIEQITTVFPHWFHPRLRFFAGREDRLPFDQNSVLALIAPRAVMLNSSYTEEQGCQLGIEQNYRSLRKVYEFLGAPQHVALRLRAGPHLTTVEDIEAYMDFLDGVFQRSRRPASEPALVFGYSLEGWKALQREAQASAPHGPDVSSEARLRWALGQEPPQVLFPAAHANAHLVNAGWTELLYGRPIKSARMKAMAVAYGVDLKADLYLPMTLEGKLPLVVWLHPYSYSTGYSRDTKAPFEELTRRGYAVLAFDQVGFGTRGEQAKDFYQRYPRWSMLGKMVADTRAAISAASAQDAVDAGKIFLCGYSLGGMVALWTAAFDPRVTGVVSIAGITPLRDSERTGAAYFSSHVTGLLPRLGQYQGRSRDVPVDYDDVLRAIGERQVLLVAPTHDRFADLGALRKLTEPFRNVQLVSPDDFNRLPESTQKIAFDWLDGHRLRRTEAP